jgi:glucose/arabinose dehydrogenase
MTFLQVVFLVIAFASFGAFTEHIKSKPLCFEEIKRGLDNPIGIIDPGTNELYVVEQKGYVQNIKSNETILDISHKIHFSEDNGEKGLYSVVFSPHRAENGKYYVMYAHNDNDQHVTRISEFDVESNERVLLDIPQPTNFNNGGSLFLDPDHKNLLYISVGDGGVPGDLPGNAQNTSNLLGSVLRIDLSGGNETFPYTIPDSNPFHGDSTKRGEIYAYGFRNPWRCTLSEGKLFCGDPGEDLVEEINIVLPGKNYGWNFVEGDRCFLQDCNKSRFEAPVFVYNPQGFGAVIGGYVSDSDLLPSFRGQYLFADLAGRFFSFQEFHNSGLGDLHFTEELNIHPNCTTPGRFILSFGRDSFGFLYVLSTDNLGVGDTEGYIHMLTEFEEDIANSGTNIIVPGLFLMAIIIGLF